MKQLDSIKREAKKPPFFYTYLITDPSYYGQDVVIFEKNLQHILTYHSIDMVCFRDKKTKDIEPLAKKCLEISKQFEIKKILINSNIEMANKLGFDGVHLTSKQFDQIKYAKQCGLYTLASTHTTKDVELCKMKNVDGVTYSPIFFTKNKGKPKGCEELATVVKQYQDESFYIFGLGGITTKEKIAMLKKTACCGYASISYFFNALN